MGLRIDPPFRFEPATRGGESRIERAIRESGGFERGGGLRVIRPDVGAVSPVPTIPAQGEEIDILATYPVGRAPPKPPPMVLAGPAPVQAADWFEYWKLIAAGVAAIEPPAAELRVIAPLPAPGNETVMVPVTTSPLIEEDEGMAHFVDELGDIALDVIREKVGLGTVAPAQVSQSLLAPGTIGPSLDTSQLYNPMTGKFYTKKRKRRRRLATQSDLCDLAALKNILSPSEFKTWIACAKR